MYKRVISGILALAMVFQLCAVTSYASENTDAVQGVERGDTLVTESEAVQPEAATVPEAECASENTTESGITEEQITENTTESGNTEEQITENTTESDSAAESMEESGSAADSVAEKTTESENEEAQITETDCANDSAAEDETEEMPKDMPVTDEDGDGEETDAVEEGEPGYLFQAGGFKVLNEDAGYESEISLFSAGDIDQLADTMYEALKIKETTIAVKDYGFYWDSTEDRQQLLGIYYAVVNDHPDLYYVRTGYGVSYNTKTKLITKISPQYFPNIDDVAFQKGVQEAKAVVTQDMDDLQKAIALHEYIVLNCEYDKERLADKTIPKESYGAYGVLANHIAVCQGYALAYKYLLNEYGIECYIVTSDAMNHAWNIVRIDGELYQVDATWDDPTWDKYGLVSHSNMFLSDSAFGKNHRDWYVTKGSGIVDIKAEGTKYDDAFWQSVVSPLVYDSGQTKKYYYVSDDKKLQSRACSISQIAAEPEILKTIDTAYSGLALDGTRLYYNTNKNISYIDISEKPTDNTEDYREYVRYTLKDEDTDNIYGFTRDDSIIRYVKRAAFALSGKSTVYVLDDSGEDVSEAEGNTYTVTFQDSFGTVFDTQTIAEGGYAVPPDKKMTPAAGYQLSYWKGNYSNVRKDEIVSAVYTKISYKILYELNGGTNSSKNVAKYDVETATINLEPPEREYYVFSGWYQDSDFNTFIDAIPKGSTGNLTLYAKWIPKEYSISYALTGGVNSPENPAEYNIETEDIVLANPTRDYYHFAGWYADETYQNRITIIGTGSSGERTLYAKWNPVTYHISYELNGGVNSAGNPSNYNIETAGIYLAAPTHDDTHCRFEGWYTDKAFTQEITAIGRGSHGNISLYAKWGHYYRVRFFDASGKLISETEVKEGADADVSDFEVPVGYELQGWDKDYTNVQQDLDIKAVYAPRKYTITYELRDGINASENPSVYTIETDTFRLAAPTHPKKELTFAGWYLDEKYQEEIISVERGQVGDITLYAKWTGVWMEAEELSGDAGISYTGNAVTFDKLTVYNGYEALKPGIDYTVSYANNMNTADMTAKKAPAVIITGKGNYQGKYTKTFTIHPARLEQGVSVPEMAAAYKKGKVQKPVPTVVWNGKKLVNNKDFTVSYDKTPIEPGNYEVVITGKGNFTGTVTTTLTITDNAGQIAMSSVKIAKKIPAQEYSPEGVTLQEDMITLRYGTSELIAGRDYEFVKHTYQDAGTHYVTIRGTGGKYIGDITTTFNIKGTNVSQLKADSVIYTGSRVNPVIKNKDGQQLTENEDYVINFLTGSETAGTAKINITGINAYYGTVTKTFQVKAHPISDNGITAVFAKGGSTQPYEKNGAKPKVVLTYNGQILAEGTDYTLSYKNNKTIGQTATVTISGRKNFNAKRTLSFVVGKGSLQNTTVTVADKVVSSRAGGYVSVPVLKDANGNKLVAGRDYDKNIVYKDGDWELDKRADRLLAGAVVTVEITGKGNYAGTTATASYRILAAGKDISKAKVTVNNKFYYNGSSIVLSPDDLTVKIGKVTLSAADYEILPETYVNNNKKGTAQVTIRGIGAYGGTKTIRFKINAQKMEK